jgi:hypothetical protein
MGEIRNACIFVRNSEEKRPLGKPRRRWYDNMKMNLKEIRCEDRLLAGLTGTEQGPVRQALLNTVINLQFA